MLKRLLVCAVLAHLGLAAPLAGQHRSSLVSAVQMKPADDSTRHSRLELAQEQGLSRSGKIMLSALAGFVVGATTTALIVNNQHCDGCIATEALSIIAVGAGGLVGALIGGALAASIIKPERQSMR